MAGISICAMAQIQNTFFNLTLNETTEPDARAILEGMGFERDEYSSSVGYSLSFHTVDDVFWDFITIDFFESPTDPNQLIFTKINFSRTEYIHLASNQEDFADPADARAKEDIINACARNVLSPLKRITANTSSPPLKSMTMAKRALSILTTAK